MNTHETVSTKELEALRAIAQEATRLVQIAERGHGARALAIDVSGVVSRLRNLVLHAGAAAEGVDVGPMPRARSGGWLDASPRARFYVLVVLVLAIEGVDLSEMRVADAASLRGVIIMALRYLADPGFAAEDNEYLSKLVSVLQEGWP